MKTLFTLLGLALVCSLSAQNNVIFRVDMNDYTGSYGMVNVNGTFNDWCGECAPMTDDDSDGVYELAIDLPDGQHEYKFTLDGWTEQENFAPGASCTLTTGEFTNRVTTVSGDTTLDIVCWESCSSCGDGPVSGDITFQVNMADYTGAIGMVNLNGTFNNWCGECAVMTDDNGDDIYELTVTLPIGTAEYKFTVDGWTVDETLTEGSSCTVTTDGFTNRFINVEGDEVLAPVCWETCNECSPEGLEELASEIDIFPNPATDQVRVQLPEWLLTKSFGAEIYDMKGQLVQEVSVSELRENGFINLQSLDSGIYTLSVITDEGRATKTLSVK